MNKVIILGRLGQDPELKYLPNGSAVCHLSVATSESWNDKNGQRHEKTEWHRVVVWGKLAELANQYLSKGRQVLVEGKLQTRSWEDKDKNKRYATEVLASTVQFIGGSSSGKSKEENHHDTHSDNSHSSAAMDEGIPGVDDVSFASDDIPF